MDEIAFVLDTDYSAEAKLIYIALAYSRNKEGSVEITYEQLQHKTNLPIRALNKALRGEEFDVMREWADNLMKKHGRIKVSTIKYDDRCLIVLDYLNKKANKSYRQVDANLKLINARFKEGATIEEMKAVVDMKVDLWTGTKMESYIRPATLFNGEKYNSYIGEINSQKIVGVPTKEEMEKPLTSQQEEVISDAMAAMCGMDEI